eukprot:6200583-Pleurochrysis_carterae.AAC.1
MRGRSENLEIREEGFDAVAVQSKKARSRAARRDEKTQRRSGRERDACSNTRSGAGRKQRRRT